MRTKQVVRTMRVTATAGRLAGAALAVSAAVAQPNPPSPPTPPSAPSTPASTTVSGRLAPADLSFMKDAAEAGAAEIEASRLALQRAAHADVKSFAEQMVSDHGKAGSELAALAAAKQVPLPAGPSLFHKARLKLLDASKGTSFDKRYAALAGVKAHEDAVKLFQKAAASAQDADVKAFAAKTLPTLQHHLEMARAMDNVVDSAVGSASD